MQDFGSGDGGSNPPGSITNSGYQSLTGVSATTALKELKALVDLGILERKAPSRKKTQYVLRENRP